jgi:uncharacterized membrane protein
MFFQGNSLAATIHGTVYEWNSFTPLNNSVVEINSTPVQSFVATDAEYTFNLTPGTYLITSNYFEGNKRVYTTKDAVVISDDGEYVHDLLMFPTYEEELLEPEEFEVPDMNIEETSPADVTTAAQDNYQTTFLVSAFLALIVLLLAGYFLGKRHRKHPGMISRPPGENGELETLQAYSTVPDSEFSDDIKADSVESHAETADISQESSAINPEFSAINSESSADITEKVNHLADNTEKVNHLADNTEKVNHLADKNKFVQQIKHHNPDRWHFPFSSKENKSNSDTHKNSRINLPEDLKELLELIRNSGNRITQREIRKKSPYSESKVSLMLSDLEQRGLIEKFKRGRGNIIRIPDKHIHKQTENESKKE